MDDALVEEVFPKRLCGEKNRETVQYSVVEKHLVG